ncbi:phage tail assembly chaperone [Photobacterium frigidiphilum]|uniref:phage tail assembly chaperone n=1 Tax=Photobacterium frigidiphilum TaxID=264736 RepID=UPI003D129469
MTLLVLGKTPDSFESQVELIDAGGVSQELPLTFKYFTSLEYAKLSDGWGEIEAKYEKVSSSDTNEAVVRETFNQYGEVLHQILIGWGIDAEFNKKNIVKLCDEYPDAFATIVDKHRCQLLERRLGN